MVHHRNGSTINHKALETLPMATTPAVHQVNFLPFSYYYRSKGTSSLPRWRRGTPLRETHRLFDRISQNRKKHTFCLSTLTHHTSSQPEGTTTIPSLQPILIDDNGTPVTWTLVLFQQAIDRQDRIQTEGRFSLLELLEIHP